MKFYTVVLMNEIDITEDTMFTVLELDMRSDIQVVSVQETMKEQQAEEEE